MRRLAGVIGVLVLSLSVTACENKGGGFDPRPSKLTWEGRQMLVTPPGMRSDRVLAGIVRNDSMRQSIAIDADAVRLIDVKGRTVPGSVRFLSGFTHGLATPDRPSVRPGLAELENTGRVLNLKPGQRSPINAAWRLAKGGSPPVKIDYGPGTLAIPGSP